MTTNNNTMSQWDQVFQHNLFSQVWGFYKNRNFPINIRIRLNPLWLEYHVRQIYATANPENPENLQFYEEFKKEVIQTLNASADYIIETAKKSNDIAGIAIGLDLTSEIYQLSAKYQNDPVSLFCTIKSCLDYEAELIAQVSSGNANSAPITNNSPQSPQRQTIVGQYNNLEFKLNKIFHVGNEQTYMGEILRINKQLGSTIIGIASLREDKASLEMSIQQLSSEQQINGVVNQELQILQMQWMTQQNELMEKIQCFKRNVVNFTSTVKNAIGELKNFTTELLQLIAEWKLDQQRSANGMHMTHRLDRIASLAKMLVSAVLELNRQLNCRTRIEECLRENMDSAQDLQDLSQVFNEFKADLEQVLHTLVTGTFLVETQPPQLLRLKSTIKQDIKLQLLVGNALTASSLRVKAILIDKDEAQKLHDNPVYQPKPALALKLNEVCMDSVGDKFVANFSGITLPEKRKESTADKKTKGQKGDAEDGSVAQKKYCFYFSTTFVFPEFSASYTVWTTSLPVVITVHPTQHADAWATILWDNAFALPNRRPFEVPKEVDPDALINAISHVFSLQTRRELSDSQKSFLRKKLMGNNIGNATWQMFFENKLECAYSKRPRKDDNKEKVKEKEPTFHIWLHAIKKFCESSANKEDEQDECKSKAKRERKGAKDATTIPYLWAGKYIEGFISKEQLVEKLKDRPPGTFILYFSEAILGSITVAWYNFEKKVVDKYAPYEEKELISQSLDERILREPALLYLYPNIPKKSAFRYTDDTYEINRFKMEMIARGYIWHTQQQMADNSSLRERQCSGTSTSVSVASPQSNYSSYTSNNNGGGSPHSHYGSIKSFHSQSTGYGSLNNGRQNTRQDTGWPSPDFESNYEIYRTLNEIDFL